MTKYLMPLIKFTDEQITRRLRWVMIGVMLFSIVNTLAGQPESFWLHPETAIRGDGLSIYNETNHTFDFFLGLGWQAYLIASLVYLSGAFLLVSVLPKRAALITIFSFILGHYFGATNWLAVRWHLGINAPSIYGVVLVTIIVFSAFPVISSNTAQVIKGLRWVMIAVILIDPINTLIGQPASYWHHPETVHEGNQFSRFFLIQGWYAYCLIELIYCSLMFWLVSVFPKRLALIFAFYFIFVHFIGASNWFFYEWRMGMEIPVIYGSVLSVIIVLFCISLPHRLLSLKECPEPCL
jgi:hypothetical protein